MATDTTTTIINKYVVEDFVVGKYSYDTVFIKKDNKVIQIPCLKDLKITKGQELVIDFFDRPIEKLV